MRAWSVSMLFAAGVAAGCMASGIPLSAQDPSRDQTSGGPRERDPGLAATLAMPLILDRTDLRIGTTAQFRRVPQIGELHDLTLLPALARVVLSLPEWPSDFATLEPLDQLREGTDLLVVLPGYPPSRAAAEIWDYLRVPLRIVVLVPGPPISPHAIQDLNLMRRLERVIAQMDRPARSGFESLQRPLSFRVLKD